MCYTPCTLNVRSGWFIHRIKVCMHTYNKHSWWQSIVSDTFLHNFNYIHAFSVSWEIIPFWMESKHVTCNEICKDNDNKKEGKSCHEIKLEVLKCVLTLESSSMKWTTVKTIFKNREKMREFSKSSQCNTNY